MQKLYNSLQNALSSCPESYSFEEIRHHIIQALSKLSKLAHKKQERTVVNNNLSWQEMLKTGLFNPNTSKRTMDIINRMIQDEKLKLEKLIKEKPEEKPPLDTLLG